MLNRDPHQAVSTPTDPASATRPEPAVCGALAEVVPAFVHHLNNALATVIGLTDLVAHRPEREDASALLKTVGEQAELCVARVRSLSELAKLGSGGQELEDLGALLERGHHLIEPLATTLGAELHVNAPSGAVPARMEARAVLQWLVTASTNLLRKGARLDWAIGSDSGAPTLEVRVAGTSGSWAASNGELADLGRAAGALRVERASGAERLVLAGAGAQVAEATPAGNSICVLEGDPHLAGLLPDVLMESGFQACGVANPQDALGQLQPGGVLLVDSRLTGDWLDEAQARGARVGLLGVPEAAPAAALPAIERPFGPQELLDFVSELAGGR